MFLSFIGQRTGLHGYGHFENLLSTCPMHRMFQSPFFTARNRVAVIPTARYDRFPRTSADGAGALWIVHQEIPNILAGLENFVVIVPRLAIRFAGSQIGPDILRRVQLG